MLASWPCREWKDRIPKNPVWGRGIIHIINVHVCIHIYIYIYIYTYIYIYIYVHMYVTVYAYIHVFTKTQRIG